MSLADRAASRWGARVVRLIKARENDVYEIALADGARAALRVHRAGYQSSASILSELALCEHLGALGLPVPRPVLTAMGQLTDEIDGRQASVVTWVDGVEIGDADTPLGLDPAPVEHTYRRLGRLIADIHNATDTTSAFGSTERPHWDADGFLGDAPNWGRFWENPALTAAERATLLRARDRARERMERLVEEGIDFGLIHADVLRENVLDDGERLSLIDFDDSGWGFRAYDLATAEVQGLEDPMNPVASSALWEGYTQQRRADAPPLGPVPFFVAMRTFASAGWIISRAPPDDPRQRFYAGRAVRAAEALVL